MTDREWLLRGEPWFFRGRWWCRGRAFYHYENGRRLHQIGQEWIPVLRT